MIGAGAASISLIGAGVGIGTVFAALILLNKPFFMVSYSLMQ